MADREDFLLIGGPCAVESAEQIDRLAAAVASCGVTHLRAGAWKPRTRPDTFQGLGRRGVILASEAASRHGLRLVTEVLDPRDAEWSCDMIDVAQIGARNMLNVPLLRAVADCFSTVLLKRGNSATLAEWRGAVDYLLERDSSLRILVCERGLRGFEPTLRNHLDLPGAVAFAQDNPDVQVIIDPSHGTGRKSLVAPMCLAAQAAGLRGAIVEVHDAPEKALCDGGQAISVVELDDLASRLRRAPVS